MKIAFYKGDLDFKIGSNLQVSILYFLQKNQNHCTLQRTVRLIRDWHELSDVEIAKSRTIPLAESPLVIFKLFH
jgi:hypothetical protein